MTSALTGWRLATGLFTVLPVRSVTEVDRAAARWAIMLAPVAAVPLGVLVGLVVWAGGRLALSPFAVAVAAVALLAMGSRIMHLDGLSDTADGLTASYDRERSLEVMKGGTAGPAGVVAVVLVLLLQVAGLTSLSGSGSRGAILAGLLVCCSRLGVVVGCARGVPAARPDGLGVTFAGVVPRTAVALIALVGLGIVAAPRWPGHWWLPPLAVLLGVLASAALVRRCVRRFGGITGDVLGAATEIALAVMLLVVS